MRDAADAGDTDAMTDLADLYELHGETAEVEHWYRELERALRTAADSGDTDAMNDLGVLYREKREDTDRAMQWYRTAAEAGHAIAMVNLGVLHHERMETDEAEGWLRKATEAGEVDAMLRLGILLNERGEATGDELWYQEAEIWYQIAAEAGQTDAMNRLAVLVLEQQGDFDQAEHWYQKAADAGDAVAAMSLALLDERRDETAANAAEPVRRAPGEVAEAPIALWSDEAAERFRGQWRDLKAQFIDDPDGAVSAARNMVTRAVHELVDMLLTDGLDPYRDSDPMDTEAMRVAMRGYREFLDRVLAI